MNVVNNLEDGLSSRCTHNLENLATSLKVSIVPEDMALFFLEFVFDENDISLLHRVDLFLYRFFIILLEPKPFVYQSPRKCTKWRKFRLKKFTISLTSHLNVRNGFGTVLEGNCHGRLFSHPSSRYCCCLPTHHM
jgi:hypothetical protein